MCRSAVESITYHKQEVVEQDEQVNKRLCSGRQSRLSSNTGRFDGDVLRSA
jgi:hypothetical protein